MRIWDLPPEKLCRNHLLGEHRELHALWVILSENKKGYRNHPETKRWVGKLNALYLRHELLVVEITNRGYHHISPLNKLIAVGSKIQNEFVNTVDEQIINIKSKKCECKF